MNTSEPLTKQHWQDQEVLRRFQMISPLLQTGLDDAKRLQLRRTIADENNISVRTLYRYEKAFTEKQFAGLRPADREKHRSQSLPENFEYLLEQAIQFRKEVPERSVAKIIYILEAEGLVAPGVLKRSTLERHIYKAGYGRKQMQMYKEARSSSSKRFCKRYETKSSLIGHTVEISYDPASPEQITVSYRGMEPFTAVPLKIGPYCDKSPALPASMQEQTPTTSRFLDALEKRHEQNRRQMADAISFAAYRKEADD